MTSLRCPSQATLHPTLLDAGGDPLPTANLALPLHVLICPSRGFGSEEVAWYNLVHERLLFPEIQPQSTTPRETPVSSTPL